jgi:hypothetical protein
MADNDMLFRQRAVIEFLVKEEISAYLLTYLLTYSMEQSPS